MMFDYTLASDDWQAIWLTLELALTVTVILLLLSTPLAWWLARNDTKLSRVIASLVALPLVLPPTVLGFYLLMMMGPNGWLGNLTESLGIGLLPFTYSGLVIASVIYSLPFVVQPLQNSFQSVPQSLLDSAATLRARPIEQFFYVALPIAKPGYLSAAILGFAHTLGEFGVVLMIGGNIPGATKVISTQIYDHVESLTYDNAHGLSLLVLAMSFVLLLTLNLLNRKPQVI
ncbi:MAG: molybdate ABC transporter permease subunit [Kangiellaceae bacterium]|jgi:molybdate transport system permease protein|nr:molybdate ABC transporter permease subunit [Kangiellaceae bacterium]